MMWEPASRGAQRIPAPAPLLARYGPAALRRQTAPRISNRQSRRLEIAGTARKQTATSLLTDTIFASTAPLSVRRASAVLAMSTANNGSPLPQMLLFLPRTIPQRSRSWYKPQPPQSPTRPQAPKPTLRSPGTSGAACSASFPSSSACTGIFPGT